MSEQFKLRRLEVRPDRPWSPRLPALGEGVNFIFPRLGAGTYEVGAGFVPLNPGDLLVVSPASGGRLCVRPGGQLVCHCFYVGFEQILPLLTAQEICLLPAVISAFKQPRFYPAAGAVASECCRRLRGVPDCPGLHHRAQLLGIIATILAPAFREAAQRSSGSVNGERHLSRVLEQLTIEDLIRRSVEELAGLFRCSRRHLTRIFQQHFGCSVLALRMEMRLLRALSLLRDPEAKVINIAEQCGFGNLGFFNTCFRRRFGASPSQWRRQLEVREAPPAQRLAAKPSCRLRAGGLCPWSASAARTMPLLDQAELVSAEVPPPFHQTGRPNRDGRFGSGSSNSRSENSLRFRL